MLHDGARGLSVLPLSPSHAGTSHVLLPGGSAHINIDSNIVDNAGMRTSESGLRIGQGTGAWRAARLGLVPAPVLRAQLALRHSMATTRRACSQPPCHVTPGFEYMVSPWLNYEAYAITVSWRQGPPV